jgi:adhesin/invasin
MLSRLSLLIVILTAGLAAACDRVPLLGPSGSTIVLSAQASSLAPGASTQVTATVMESGGTPVHDGTLVRFSASMGRVDPAEVETRGGSATTTFIAGTSSGTAQVRATSGAAGGGEGDTPANVVSITIGGAAATVVTVSASPSRVGPSGGSVAVVASAVDAAGNRLVGVPISFSTNVGSLSSSSAVTDANGEARVTLTTDREAVVTARVGDKSSTVTVTASTAATVSLTTEPASPVVGAPVTLTVTPAAGTSPRVVVNWGDGSTEDLGVVSASRTVRHTYQREGTFTITAAATADGETFSSATNVTVSARPGINVNVTASPTSGPRCTPFTFTAETSGDTTASFSAYRWTIDSNSDAEDETVTTSGNRLTRVFAQTGIKTVSVTATTTDGRSGNGQTQVVVTQSTPPSTSNTCP